MESSFLNPASAVNNFNLAKGMSVADFGCGAGHFTLAMAKIVGPEGSVSGVDVHESVLHVLEGHKKINELPQLKTVRADLEKENGSGLPGDSQDFVLCSNVLHQVEHPQAVLKEAGRVLKTNGRVAVIDWVGNSSMGPKQRISKNEVEQLARSAGFELEGEFDAGTAHYGLIFVKNI